MVFLSLVGVETNHFRLRPGWNWVQSKFQSLKKRACPFQLFLVECQLSTSWRLSPASLSTLCYACPDVLLASKACHTWFSGPESLEQNSWCCCLCSNVFDVELTLQCKACSIAQGCQGLPWTGVIHKLWLIHSWYRGKDVSQIWTKVNVFLLFHHTITHTSLHSTCTVDSDDGSLFCIQHVQLIQLIYMDHSGILGLLISMKLLTSSFLNRKLLFVCC